MHIIRRMMRPLFIFIVVFAIAYIGLAQIVPGLIAQNSASLVIDANNNGLADSGDVIRYTVTIANCDTVTSDGLRYQSRIDPNTQLIPDSVQVGNLQGATPCTQQPLDESAPSQDDSLPPPPVNATAIDDTFVVTNGAIINENVLGNDTGAVPLTALSFGDSLVNVGDFVADGVATYNAPSGIVYTLDANGHLSINASALGVGSSGTDTLFYEMQATNGSTDTAQVTVTYGDFPTAVDDTAYTTTAGTPLNVVAGAGLLTNDTLGTPPATLTLFGGGDASATVTNAVGSTVNFGAGGSLTVNADGSFSFTPVTGFTGVFVFEYIINNGLGTSQATVEITVQLAPTATDDTLNAVINQTNNYVAGTLFADNGSGADNLGAPPATIISWGNINGVSGDPTEFAPASTQALPIAIGGNLTVNADGSLVVDTPTSTVTFTFQYTLSNGVAPDSVGTVTINVLSVPVPVADNFSVTNTDPAPQLNAVNLAVNDAVGVPPFISVTFGGGNLSGAVTDNTLIVGGTETLTVPFAAIGGNLTLDISGGAGTLTMSLNGTTSGTDLIAGVYTFDYQLTNSNGTSASATVTITVQSAPTAVADNFAVTCGVLDSTHNVRANDTLGLPAATVFDYGNAGVRGIAPTNPHTLANGATVTLLADGSLSVNSTGATATEGTPSFEYRLSNIVSNSDALVTLTITSASAPVAVNDGAFNTPLNTLYNGVTVIGNDTRNCGTISGFDATSANGGTVTMVTDVTSVNFGTFTYDPATGFTGADTFTYTLNNSQGSSVGTVTITVGDMPVAVDDPSYVTLQDTPLNEPVGTGVLSNDTANGAQISVVGGTSCGTFPTFTYPCVGATAQGGSIAMNANGSFTYTPDTGFTGTDTFAYTLQNGIGTDSATATITVNRAPTTVDDAFAVLWGAADSTNNVTTNDNLGIPVAVVDLYGDISAVGITTTPTNTYTLPASGGITVTLTAGGLLTVDATSGTAIAGVYTFEYRITNVAGSSVGTVQITVNQAPIANNDTFAGGYTTSLVAPVGLTRTANLFADNGSGADVLGFPIASITSFGGGSINGGGTGITDFAAGTTQNIADGTVTVNADGTMTLAGITTPGSYTLQYRLTNAIGTNDATVTIVIDAPPTMTSTTPTNGAIAVPGNATITVNFSENVDIAAGGITVECPVGTPISFTPVTASNSNSIVITPDANLPGNTLCTVTLVSANITDTDTNDAPNNLDGNSDGLEGGNYVFTFTTASVAVDDAYTVTPHLTFVSPTSVRNNDSPPNSVAITGFGDTALTTTTLPNGTNSVTTAGNGRVVMNADGTFTYYPAAGVSNTSDSFFYTITGGSTAQVTLNIQNQELVWFVNNGAVGTVCTGNNVGTQACPSADLATVAGVDTANDTIYIAQGNYTCNITLENGERLVGDGSSSTLATISGVAPVVGSSLPAFSGTVPTLSNAAGDCITLAQNNVVRGINIGNTGGYALASAVNIGTATLLEISITGNGGLFNLTGGGTFNAAFGILSSSAHSASTVNLVGTGGAISNFTASAIAHADAGSTTVNVSGSNPTWIYNGTITKTAGGRVVSVQNTTANTVALNGAITQNVAAGTGILVNANAGNVTFSSLSLGSAGTRMIGTPITITNNAVTSTVNLGAISVFSNNTIGLVASNNASTINSTSGTVNATNGTAISITGPAGLTPLGMTLTSVASSNTGNGIAISNTSGSFTITGTGAAGSGGTIQNTSNHGINLNNVTNISLNNLQVQNISLNGVNGTEVTNFAFTNGGITDVGTSQSNDRLSCLAFNRQQIIGGFNAPFNNLDGTFTLTNSTCIRPYGLGLDVMTYSGTITNAVVTGNTFTSTTSTLTSRGTAISFYMADSPTTVSNLTGATISNNEIYNFPMGTGITVGGAVAPPPQNTQVIGSLATPVTIASNTIQGVSAANRIGAEGIVTYVGHRGTGYFIIDDNAISNVTGTGISSSAFGDVTMTSIITNNTIVANNSFASQGIGGGISQGASAVMNMTVSNNTISQVDGNGILLVARDGTSTLRARVLNNDVAVPLAGIRQGIRLDAGNPGSTNDSICAQISGNTSAGTGVARGIGLRKQGTLAGTHAFGVVGMVATATPNVEAYINSLNPLGNDTLLISAESGFTNCALP